MPFLGLGQRQFLDFRHDHAGAFYLHVFDRPEVQLDIVESGRRQVFELFKEDALGLLGVVDVDVIPLPLGQLGQVLDEAGVPLGADTHDGEMDLLLGGLLGELPADLFARGLAVGQNDDLRQLVRAAVLLHFRDAKPNAFVHRRPAGIDVEHVDSLDHVFDLGLVGQAGAGQHGQGVVRESDDRERVVRSQLGDGVRGGLLDSLEPADAGAVFFIHGAAHVEHQGQIQA